MKIVQRNFPILFLYFAIFLGLAIGIQMAVGNKSVVSFEPERLSIGIVNEDGGELAEGLIEYVGQVHDITMLENDKSVIQEQLFYRNVHYVIVIPENFEVNCLDNGEKMTTTKIPDSYYTYYAEQRIDGYMNGVRVYKAAGYSMDEAIDLIVEQGKEVSQVEILDVNGNKGEVQGYMYFLVYYPYLFITVICFALSFVMMVFQDKEIKRRMLSSSVSQMRQKAEGGLALAVVGIVFFAVCILIPTLMYPDSFLNDPHLGYLLLNAFTLLLASLAIGFLVGMAAKNKQIANNIINAVSLGMCFLGGVFVSIDFMGDNVQKISQFLPVYWYEKNLDILAAYSNLSQTLKSNLFKGFGIQFIFAVACVGIALVISKYRTQES